MSSSSAKKSKKWLWIGLLLVVLIAAGVTYKMKDRNKITYREFKLHRGDLEKTILSTGTVQPENRLEIKAPIAGRIDQVLTDEGKLVKKGQILAWMSSTERAALLDAARARGTEELRRWEDMYKPTPILAPLPGTIILRNVEPGQTITATDAIFAMSDRLTVKAQVDETDIAKIQLHQKAEIVLDAYPDKKLEASVDQIAFEAKTVNNVTTYVVDVLPSEAPAYMRAGMTANVSFSQEKKEDALLLSSEAIMVSDGKSKVLVRVGENPPEERLIETGLSDGKRTEVVSGLQEGDVVVRAEMKDAKPGSSNPFSPFGSGRPGGRGMGGGRGGK